MTYFGSAGLNAVLGCYERGLSDGVSVRVVASNAEVIMPIEVTKLDKVLQALPDRDGRPRRIRRVRNDRQTLNAVCLPRYSALTPMSVETSRRWIGRPRRSGRRRDGR